MESDDGNDNLLPLLLQFHATYFALHLAIDVDESRTPMDRTQKKRVAELGPAVVVWVVAAYLVDNPVAPELYRRLMPDDGY